MNSLIRGYKASACDSREIESETIGSFGAIAYSPGVKIFSWDERGQTYRQLLMQ